MHVQYTGDYHLCIHTEYDVSVVININDKFFFLINKLNASLLNIHICWPIREGIAQSIF